MIAQALNNIRTESTAGTYDPTHNFWYPSTGYVAGMGSSATGLPSGPDASLGIGTAYRCIEVMANTVGAMPWHIFEDGESTDKRKAKDHDLYRALHTRPNEWQTPIDFKSMACVHLHLRGNFYARVDPPGIRSDSIQLVPLHPDRTQVEQLTSGRVRYKHTYEDGRRATYSQDAIYHVRLMCKDGVNGMTGARYASEVIGTSIAQMRYSGSMYGNGGFFKYYLKTGKKLGEEGQKNFRAGWRDVHGKGKFSPPILEEDMELVPLGMTMEDAQFFEVRGGYGIEICQFFGVPPHLAFLGDDSKANMEQKGQDFLRYSLDPLLVRFEQAAQPFVGDGYFSQFNRDAIVRASLADRYSAHSEALGGRAWKSVDEVRETEDYPVMGGDAADLPPPPNASLKPGSAKQASQKFNNRATPTEDEADTRAVDLSPFVQDAAERIVTREVEHLGRRADKATRNRNEWNKWAAAWYTSHSRYVAETVTPLCVASGAATWDVSEWADSYCVQSMNALDGQSVAETLETWQDSKAAEVAAQIREAINDV